MAQRKSFLLRIDPALWAEVERLAQSELRSVNAQIEYLIREALARRARPRPPRAGDASRAGSEHE
jgi:hypothetical protein